MLREIKLGLKRFPRLFMAENAADADEARAHGLPYLIVPPGKDEDYVVKCLLLNLAEKMMPGVDWARLWGITRQDLDWVDDGSVIKTTGKEGEVAEYDVKKYLATNRAKVELEELEALKLLPKFLADITEAIRINFADMSWTDGYNKKLGLCCGNWNPASEAGNLIILDISASIPVGISSTMLYLIDTLRHKTNAELIITGANTMYWGINDVLPKPTEIRKLIPRSNESEQFQKIVKEKIAGRHWANIISFGDNDSPWWSDLMDRTSELHAWRWMGASDLVQNEPWLALQGTVVDNLWSFHTWQSGVTTGYARLFKPFAKAETFNSQWCRWVKS